MLCRPKRILFHVLNDYMWRNEDTSQGNSMFDQCEINNIVILIVDEHVCCS